MGEFPDLFESPPIIGSPRAVGRLFPGLPAEREILVPLRIEEVWHRAERFDSAPLVQSLQSRFRCAFEAMEICGIHPMQRSVLIDPKTGERIEESFSNVGYHSIAVAECTQRIADACLDMALLEPQDVESAVERALIHDLLKPFEILNSRGKNKGGGSAWEVFDRRAAASIVSRFDVEPCMADYILSAGSETGGVNVGSFIEIEQGKLRLRASGLVSKIIRLADTMTFTDRGEPGKVPMSTFLTPWERLVASNSAARYPLSLRHGFVSLDDGTVTLIQDIDAPPPRALILGHMLYLETLVANWICDELRESLMLGVGWPAEQLLKALVHGEKAEESAVS